MDLIAGYLHSGFSAIGPFVILLGLLIFVHEMGHFLVAKYFGVRVEVFSLGFGKKIFQFKRGDTNYCISLVPLGGYVKMYGDEIGADISEENKKYSFTHKPVSQRIAVVLAGPMMNLFFAIFLFTLISVLGEELKAPVVGDISPNSAAATAGFKSGDKVLMVGNSPIASWDQFQDALNRSSSLNVSVKVQRQDGSGEANVNATLKQIANPNILSVYSVISEIEGISSNSAAPMIGVLPGSAAEKAGFKTGDLISKWNGEEVKYFRDLNKVVLGKVSQASQVEVKRIKDSNAKKLEFETVTISASIGEKQISSISDFGIESGELYLAKVIKDSPAEKAGLKDNDKVVAVNSIAITKWDEILNQVKSYNGNGAIVFDILRDGKPSRIEIAPQITEQTNGFGAEEKRFTVGIIPHSQFASSETVVIRASNPVAAISRGLERTGTVTSMTVVSFLRLIQGMISPKNIGGIISIGQAASETFKMGFTYFLTMMSLISINLFVLNLLPIPVLDGGHLLFYIVEAIRGAPVSMRKMEVAQQVGLVLLMSLMVFSFFNDVSRLFGK